MENYADLMFQNAVAELQKEDGVFEQYQKAYVNRTQVQLDPRAVNFIRERESFYMASINQQGWPYIQHRGGAKGFLTTVGPTTLACADYDGNRQYISMGNLKASDKVSLFFMDYQNHMRLKLQGTAKLQNVEDAKPEIVQRLAQSTEHPFKRVLEIQVIAIDWNCPRHIPTLYSESVMRKIFTPQIQQLTSENNFLKNKIRLLEEELQTKTSS